MRCTPDYGTHAYWGNRGDGTISRISKSGGTVEQVAGPSSTRATGIVVESDYVYWTALGETPETGVVMQAPKDGSGATQITPTSQPGFLVADETWLYWTEALDPDGTVKRVPKAGGAVEVLAIHQPEPHAIAVDDVAVYWSTMTDGRILRMAK